MKISKEQHTGRPCHSNNTEHQKVVDGVTYGDQNKGSVTEAFAGSNLTEKGVN